MTNSWANLVPPHPFEPPLRFFNSGGVRSQTIPQFLNDTNSTFEPKGHCWFPVILADDIEMRTLACFLVSFFPFKWPLKSTKSWVECSFVQSVTGQKSPHFWQCHPHAKQWNGVASTFTGHKLIFDSSLPLNGLHLTCHHHHR